MGRSGDVKNLCSTPGLKWKKLVPVDNQHVKLNRNRHVRVYCRNEIRFLALLLVGYAILVENSLAWWKFSWLLEIPFVVRNTRGCWKRSPRFRNTSIADKRSVFIATPTKMKSLIRNKQCNFVGHVTKAIIQRAKRWQARLSFFLKFINIKKYSKYFY